MAEPSYLIQKQDTSVAEPGAQRAEQFHDRHLPMRRLTIRRFHGDLRMSPALNARKPDPAV